jgi:hypothetical protein
MTDLERRYLRLVRLFYPARYRHERGTEIVGTYLDLAAPQRRWPSAADVADLAGGGLRERLRAAGTSGLGAGIRLAGTLALLTATALAAGWTPLEVNSAAAVTAFGRDPSVSLGVGVWAAWLLAAVVHVAAPGRWTRAAIGGALVVTVVVVPLAAVTGSFRPPLFVLLPQAALGLVALGASGRPPVWLRLLPLAGAAAALSATVNLPSGDPIHYYDSINAQVLPTAGVLLLLATLLLGAGLALRNDFRGAWATLVLLGPIGMLSLHPLAGALAVRWYGGGPTPTWSTLSTAAIIMAAIVVAVVAPTLALLAVMARKRVAAAHATVEHCPACGWRTSNRADR